MKIKRLTISVDNYAQHLGDSHFLNEYHPTPAEENLPDWFKKLENGAQPRTAKTCRGLYDVMTVGYMVVWPFDVTITKDENGKLFIKRTRDDDRGSLWHPHPQFQLGMYPDANLSAQKHGIDKVGLPYKVKTPKGTSIMMVQPAYRPDLKTQVMPGIIDTDKFYTPLNVLYTIKDTDRDINISAGTPLAQIIPFLRTEWEIEYNAVDEKLDRITQENTDHIDRYYQKKLWTRKFYKRKVKDERQ
jgi:hypothetical protein